MLSLPILACPACKERLTTPEQDSLAKVCHRCNEIYSKEENIWRMMPGNRRRYFEPFLADYTRIRKSENRGSESPEYYLRLPEFDPNHSLAWQWNIRAKSYRYLTERILPQWGSNLAILDMGAGCCWLSYRLRELGHRPCSLDINTDRYDGLGAAHHFRPDWPVIQAEYDSLPFSDESRFDVVIFNASLPYSTDYRVTLQEVMRVLKQDGRIVVIDSPIYRRDESGRQMVTERKEQFLRTYGTASDSVPSREYLSFDIISSLEQDLGLSFTYHRVWYGIQWALRPVKAWLYRKREPSRFAILVAERKDRAIGMDFSSEQE